MKKRIFGNFLIAIILMSIFSAFPAGAVVPSPQTIIASEDSYVDNNSGNGGNNFGAATNMVLKCGTGYRYPYRKFDLSSIRTNLASAEIESVKLKVWAIGEKTDGTATAGFDVSSQIFYVSDDAWSQSTLTYNNRPAKGSAISPTVTIPKGTTKTAFEYDITSSVISELEKSPVDNTLSCMMDGPYVNQTVCFYTTENGTKIDGANVYPRLIVTYKEPAPQVLSLTGKSLTGDVENQIATLAVPGGTAKDSQLSVNVTDAVKNEVAISGDNKLSVFTKVMEGTIAVMFYQAAAGSGTATSPCLSVTSDSGITTYIAEVSSQINGGGNADSVFLNSFEIKKGDPETDPNSRFAMLRFDITPLKSLTNITDVALKVFVKSASLASDLSVGFYKVSDDSWNPATLTYNNAPKYDSNSITQIQTGLVTPKVTIGSSYKTESKAASAIFVYYEKNTDNSYTLKDVKAKLGTIPALSQASFSNTFHISEPASGVQPLIKVYLWDGTETMKPYFVPVIFDESGIN